MNRRIAGFWIAITFAFSIPIYSASISLNMYAKNYSNSETVPVSFSVFDSSNLPGAFVIKMKYDTTILYYAGVNTIEGSPFSVAASVNKSHDTLTIAGFQGISDIMKNPYIILSQIQFTAKSNSAMIDTNAFKWINSDVYSIEGKYVELSKAKNSTSVLRPVVKGKLDGKIRLHKGTLHFPVKYSGKTSINLYSLSGRKVINYVNGAYMSQGNHGIPLGKVPSGLYIIHIKGQNFSQSQKVEVSR